MIITISRGLFARGHLCAISVLMLSCRAHAFSPRAQEDDELDDAEDEPVDYAAMALRQLEHREVDSSSKGGGSKRTNGAQHSTASTHSGGGLGGGKRTVMGEERQKAQLAKLVNTMRDLLLVYKLGTFYALRSLPPHEVRISNECVWSRMA